MKRDDHEKVPLDAKNDSDEWTATDVPDGSSIKSTKKMAILWAAKPIAALVVQLIFLTSMLSFVIWTSITPRQVPRLVANLSQSIITVHTLIGSTLSLINTMLFAEAIQFTIHVSLRSRGLSLYSLSAATSIASKTLFFSWGTSVRIKWTAMSIICVIIFTAQTSAWTTIITPRQTVSPQFPGAFLDVDFTSDPLMNGSTAYDFPPVLFQSSGSGVAAAQYAATGNWSTLQYFPYLLAGGTSRGILLNPIFALPSNDEVQVTGFLPGTQAANNSASSGISPNNGFSSSQNFNVGTSPNSDFASSQNLNTGVTSESAKRSSIMARSARLAPRASDSESTDSESAVYDSTVPIMQTQNWATIEAHQQGLSANVSCNETPANDLALNISAESSSAFGKTFTETILYCTNNASGTELNSSAVFSEYVASYMAFIVCPYWNMSNPSDNITLYMRIGVNGITPNSTVDVTCDIKPQLQNATAVYDVSRTVMVNSSIAPVDLAINKSSAVHAVISALEDNLSSVQSSDRNMVVDAIYSLLHISNQTSPKAQGENDLSLFFQLLAWYIRGVIEDASTELRSSLATNLSASDPKAVKVPLEASVPILVWGQVPSFKLVIILVPLSIMLTTISLISFSLYRASNLGLELDGSFDPMNTIHIVAACSFGNLQTISFPGYSEDISVFCSAVDVRFPKGQARSNMEGFRFSNRKWMPEP